MKPTWDDYDSDSSAKAAQNNQPPTADDFEIGEAAPVPSACSLDEPDCSACQ